MMLIFSRSGATFPVRILICTTLLFSLIPTRGDSPFRAEVIEESPVGTVIYGVEEYLTELKINADVQYQLLGDDGVSRLVSLNPTTGQLRVRARIDREALCPGGGNQNHQIPSPSGTADLFGGLSILNSKTGIMPTIMECVQPLNILLVSRTKDTGPNMVTSVDSVPRTSRILIHLVIRDINDNAPMWTQGSQLEIGFVETPNSGGIGWTPLSSGGPGAGANAGGVGTSLLEDSLVKNARTIDRAVDSDLGLNSTIVYRLLGPGAEYFRLDDGTQSSPDDADLSNNVGSYLSHSSIGNGAGPSNNYHRLGPLQLWPIVPLDRETEDFAGRGGLFNLTLLAMDMGLPPKTGSVNLLITVIDVNDHAPVFHNDMYSSMTSMGGRLGRGDAGLVIYRPPTGTIRETIPVGSLIIQLNATDRDSGAHAKLVYEFCPCDRSTAMDYFKIDRSSGRISVIKPLDYDQGPRQFQFKVIAKDSAPEPYTLTGTALVEIALTDENDEAPMIHVMLLRPPSGGETRHLLVAGTLASSLPPSHQQSSLGTGSTGGVKFLGEYTTSINENPQPESIIAYVQVTDQDHHGQDQVHCRLGPTDNFTLQLDPVGAQYATQQQPQQQQQQGEYSNSIADGSATTLNRQDFRLVTGTGMTGYSNLYQHPLDREVTPVQRVTITCTDSVGNAAYVLIHVHLVDVNDHAPEFVNGGQFAFQLAENQELIGGKPLWLGRTVATDKDVGENALITYQLRNDEVGSDSGNVVPLGAGGGGSNGGGVGKHAFETHPSRLFELDSQNGNLYAKTVFDREAAPSGGIYRLRVLAIDNGSPRLTGTATVEVFILDVNDWAPQFTKDVYTFSVPEDARIQEVIGMVEAIDRDADSQGKVTYQLVTHARQKRSNREDHRQSNLVRREAISDSHELIGLTEATEQTNDSASTTTNVKLFSPSQETRVADPELHTPGTYYAPVSLDRSGSGSNGNAVTPSYFSVDRLTGKIRLIRRLDRESIAFFSLEIVATDTPPVSILPVFHQTASLEGRNESGTDSRRSPLASQSLSTTTTVVIAVTDVNDNAPVFRRPNTSTAMQLRLHETLGRQLLIIEATDADEGENARVTYYIRSEVPRPPGGPGTGFFAVDETSGVLFLAKSLNNSTTHRLVIEACDNGSGATRRCTLSPSIRITVSDQDNPNLMLDPANAYAGRSGSATGQGSVELPYDLDTVSVQRNNPIGQSGRRNELVIVCLVVVFSILLLATIILVACLVHRRGSRTWWFMGRANDCNRDVPSYAKEITVSNKPNGTGRMSTEPWLDDNSHHDQADMALDTKFEACKSAQYDQPNELNYLGHESLLTGTAYPISSSGYLPHPGAVKLLQAGGAPAVSCGPVDGQGMTLTAHHMTPMRLRQLNSPPADYMANAMDIHGSRMLPRGPPSAEVNELLTQSTYKQPPSPDYQSLDVMWHRVPRSELAPIGRVTRYRNPIPNQSSTAAYAIGQGHSNEFTRSTVAERGLFFNPISVDMPIASDAMHTYYEITGPQPHHHQQQQKQQKQQQQQSNRSQDGAGGLSVPAHHLLHDNWGAGGSTGSDMGPKTYSSSATLGRPATGKGKRRSANKGDSMYNPQAGELVLHSSKKRVTQNNVVSDAADADACVDQKLSVTETESVNHGVKQSGQYTYQAYREGTFV